MITVIKKSEDVNSTASIILLKVGYVFSISVSELVIDSIINGAKNIAFLSEYGISAIYRNECMKTKDFIKPFSLLVV